MKYSQYHQQADEAARMMQQLQQQIIEKYTAAGYNVEVQGDALIITPKGKKE